MSPIPLPEFATQLSQILPVIMKEFLNRQSNEIIKGKITIPQFLVLEMLGKEGESKMTELAAYMNVTTAAMTGIVDRLVRDHYAERIYSPEDRRIIRIKLTAKGALLVKKIHQTRRQVILNIFSQISEEDREGYLRILSQIRDVLMKDKSA